MNTVYVTFQVHVCDNEYRFSTGQKGEASLKMEAQRSMLDKLNAGDLFKATLDAALAKYDAHNEEEDET